MNSRQRRKKESELFNDAQKRRKDESIKKSKEYEIYLATPEGKKETAAINNLLTIMASMGIPAT